MLLVDEVLAVGDEGFTHKCLDKFAEFKRRNKTILLVTHSLGLVERFCDEALWLDAGERRAAGDPLRVVGAYVTDVERQEEQFLVATDAKHKQEADRPAPASQTGPLEAGEAAEDMSRAAEGRWGSGGAIADVAVLNDQARRRTSPTATMTLALKIHATGGSRTSCLASASSTPKVWPYGRTPRREYESARSAAKPRSVSKSRRSIWSKAYKLDVAFTSAGAPYDYHRLLYTFRVKSRLKDVGIYRPRHRWTFGGSISFKPRT
jgi:ABC-type glutathione transport system ATPase component